MEIELPGEYTVVKITRGSRLNNPLIAAIIAPTNSPNSPRKVLLLERPDLTRIQEGGRYFLTETNYGKCKIYRETLPR